MIEKLGTRQRRCNAELHMICPKSFRQVDGFLDFLTAFARAAYHECCQRSNANLAAHGESFNRLSRSCPLFEGVEHLL